MSANAIPQASHQVLYEDKAKGEMTCLLEVETGATLPMHQHPEIEQTYVVEGSFCDHDGMCRAGEFVWRRVGSFHETHFRRGSDRPRNLPQAKRLPTQHRIRPRGCVTRPRRPDRLGFTHLPFPSKRPNPIDRMAFRKRVPFGWIVSPPRSRHEAPRVLARARPMAVALPGRAAKNEEGCQSVRVPSGNLARVTHRNSRSMASARASCLRNRCAPGGDPSL